MQISVKAGRVNSGMSQKAVADALKLSLSQYQRKENGHVRFYADELARLSVLLSVPILNFFEAGCHDTTQADS